jgi:hypothetical protein
MIGKSRRVPSVSIAATGETSNENIHETHIELE